MSPKKEKQTNQETINLRDNCDKILEGFGYIKTLTPEEISREEEILVDLAIRIANLEEDKKTALEEFKAKINPLKNEYGLTLGNVRSGKKYVKEEAFLIINKVSGKMEYFNQEGVLINSRPLTMEETQIKLFNDLDK